MSSSSSVTAVTSTRSVRAPHGRGAARVRAFGPGRGLVRATCFAWFLGFAAANVPALVRADSGEDTRAAAHEPPRHALLGVRGIAGFVSEEGESTAGGGAGLSVGIPFAHERWEFEGVVALIKGHELLGVVDVGVKRSFDLHRSLSPHLALGPALSVDIGSQTRVSAGGLAGVGLNWFPGDRIGMLSDLVYRLLGGEGGLEHVLSLSVGVGFWL